MLGGVTSVAWVFVKSVIVAFRCHDFSDCVVLADWFGVGFVLSFAFRSK